MASLFFFELQYIDYFIVRLSNASEFRMKQIATLSFHCYTELNTFQLERLY